MNFWKAQSDAKSKTTLYLFIFILLTLTASIFAELAMEAFAGPEYVKERIPYVGLAFFGITFLVACYNYLNYLQGGGSYVAESVGGILVDRNSRQPKERQLLNIVEEIALATSLPIPPVYIIKANEINAFAAGTSPENAAIAVTTGTLELLSRDELQGVLAHEFGHIYNKDMLIGMRVSAMITGFFIVSYIGIRLLQGNLWIGGERAESGRDYDGGDGDRKGGNPVVLVALIFLIAGTVTWLFGSILQAMVSRQREYLADACAVQYTRNPDGIAGALRKIQKSTTSDMPRDGKPFSHLYFNEHSSFFSLLFATHPPLEKRIAAIEGRAYENNGENLS